ncbi:MAG TPA: nucleotide exchange factor GrpE [Phycisphaerales bacterium]|nr:nucleotide exchange factor GrpE [Phycisphaerales bacterium]
MKKREQDNVNEAGGPAVDEGGQGQAPAEDQTAALRAELEELRGRYQRALADYRNSQQRAAAEHRQAREAGVASVVERLLSVLDHFDLALGHAGAAASVEQVVQGVRMIRDELQQTIQSLGVVAIRPEANDEYDPQRHQAVMQRACEGVEAGRVAETCQIGYAIGDRLLRPAKVIVATACERDAEETH